MAILNGNMVIGATAKDIALALKDKKALAVKIDGVLKDLSSSVGAENIIEFVYFDSKEGKEVFRHTASHVMAQAVKRLFPEAKLAIGPAVDEGFYYDIDMPRPFVPEDIAKIEKEMERIVNQNYAIERVEMSKQDAIAKCVEMNETYKAEMLNELKDQTVSFYKQAEFMDFCRGPHLPSTGYVKAFKITKIAGAYWRGDAKNQQLQRLYGVAFPSKEELFNYLKLIEEAEKRDHRKIGKTLKLFSFHDEGPGFPFWLPNGLFIFNKLIDFWRDEHRKAGYVEIKTPIMLSQKLWETSKHWFNYKENMYTSSIDGMEYAIKPMNCPGGILVYKEEVHSYKELPLRVGEIGLVHRHELSGVLSGLFRVRQFHQDDAHIYMTPAQIKDELINVIRLADRFYTLFGFDYHLELSTKPPNAIGTEEQWNHATNSLKAALDELGKSYKINEGDGAFYGPKIDFHLKDAIGRTWQCGTIQLDMAQPDNFQLTYVGEDGQNTHRPVMIHRTIFGSLERFIGILIEHYAGKFPLWLSPVQIRVITVSNKFDEYATKAVAQMNEAGLRAELDNRAESVSKKVREAQLDQINYILVVGEKEVAEGTVNVRTRSNKVLGECKLADFISNSLKEVTDKR